MIGSQDDGLKLRLKTMIIDACEKDEITPQMIPDDVELFSKKSGLELDSLDALQISMELQKDFGVRLADSKDFRRIVTTVNALADYIQSE